MTRCYREQAQEYFGSSAGDMELDPLLNNHWSQTQRVKIENLHLEGEIPFGSLVIFLVVVSVRQVVFSECKTLSPVK